MFVWLIVVFLFHPCLCFQNGSLSINYPSFLREKFLGQEFSLTWVLKAFLASLWKFLFLTGVIIYKNGKEV